MPTREERREQPTRRKLAAAGTSSRYMFLTYIFVLGGNTAISRAPRGARGSSRNSSSSFSVSLNSQPIFSTFLLCRVFCTFHKWSAVFHPKSRLLGVWRKWILLAQCNDVYQNVCIFREWMDRAMRWCNLCFDVSPTVYIRVLSVNIGFNPFSICVTHIAVNLLFSSLMHVYDYKPILAG